MRKKFPLRVFSPPSLNSLFVFCFSLACMRGMFPRKGSRASGRLPCPSLGLSFPPFLLDIQRLRKEVCRRMVSCKNKTRDNFFSDDHSQHRRSPTSSKTVRLCLREREHLFFPTVQDKEREERKKKVFSLFSSSTCLWARLLELF